MSTLVINGLEDSELKSRLNNFLILRSLHCSKCGYVLLKDKINCEYGLFMTAKCCNKTCRYVNRFVFVGKKPKLLTKNLINKTPENYWFPYTKEDVLSWIIS